MGQPIPPLFVKPFADTAAGPYITYPIPETTVDPARASLDLGFPPQTMQEVVAGGTPPFGQDFNGLLKMITANIAAINAGQPYLYDGTLATAMAGYALGAVLGMADGSGLWINLVAGNTSDPDASGAGWVPLYRYAHTPMAGLVGGTVTLTRLEASAPVIVLTGTLVSNLQVEIPAALQSWLIVNATTGAFTTTVKTPAQVGGVVVGQGGYVAPVGVYGAQDGNLYPTVAPTVIPGDVSPTADTYVIRDNTGRVYATTLISTAAIDSPVPTVGAVVVQNAAADGLLRKITMANLASQMFGTRSLAGTGWYTFPGGFKVQWGTATAAGGDTTITYPSAFTSFSRPVVSGNDGLGIQDNMGVFSAGASSFVVRNGSGSTPIWWIAVGV